MTTSSLRLTTGRATGPFSPKWSARVALALAIAVTGLPALLAAPRAVGRYHFARLQSSAKSEDRQLERLRQVVQAKLDELRAGAEFPGATVGFALPDGRSASASTGLSDVENKLPLSPTDRMLAGSIGKTYVAAVLLQLVDEKRLTLDDKIGRWFGREPWFTRLPNASDITVRMLMNHTSGIPEHVVSPPFTAALKSSPDKVWKPEELIAFVFDSKPLFPAGQGWSYADTNYIVVGMIIERITKKSLYGEVDRRILKPLKLERTIPSDRRTIPGLITGYSRPNSPFGFEGRVIIDGKMIINPQMEWTGGGFASTAEDLARWAKALYEGRVMSKSSLAQMLQGVEAKTGRGDKYGLGVQVRQSEFGVSYGHGGWFPGYLSEMEYFPEHRVAVAIQFNTDAGRTLKKGLRAYIADFARIIIDNRESGTVSRSLDPHAALISMVATERRFAAASVEKNTREAFLAFIADDGILFRPHAVAGKRYLTENARTQGLLTWRPLVAEIAASGEMGYTTGSAEYRPERSTTVTPVWHGHFVTIWKKQPDQTWKFAIDTGISNPRPPVEAPEWQPPAVKSNLTAKRVDVRAERDRLIEMDRQLAKTAAESGAQAAFLAYADDAIRFYRNDNLPAVGKESMRAMLAGEKTALNYRPEGGEVSLAGDLGYTYGSSEARPADTKKYANYLRIWKRGPGGQWRVILDVSTPQE
ncbi:MAG TPA: serine hydrolase [Blastocatellia bacterium]|nr:serine hydrolase [Blastocatellia bacterium]